MYIFIFSNKYENIRIGINGRLDTIQAAILLEKLSIFDCELKLRNDLADNYSKNILEVKHNGKNIHDVLELTIEQAIQFFSSASTILKKLKPMFDVGLGYLRLGQSSSTLSGGEAQRLKLASYLIEEKSPQNNSLYIFDEPTSGLHNKDIAYFMSSISRLIDMGNSVVIIEHNTELIKQADRIIDMGPEGGDKGGEICYQGTPIDLIKIKNNKTAKYLKNQFVKH